MASSSGTRLARFFVYNSSFGPREGEEHKKVIFFHSEEEARQIEERKDEDEDLEVPAEKSEDKVKHVGFAEACANFSKVFFGPEEPVKAVQTQRTKTSMFEAEPGYWMVLTVNLPYQKKRNKAGTSDYTEFNPEAVHDNVLNACLTHAHEMFRFFAGGFQHVMDEEEGDLEVFKERVSAFFSKYVNVHLRQPGSDGILELFHAVQFLSLEMDGFTGVQGLVRRVQDDFPQVSRAVFLQEGNVVWSDLQQEDTKLLYHYITKTLLPANSGSSLMSPTVPSRGPFAGHQGRYLTGGPVNVASLSDDPSHDFNTPVVHLMTEYLGDEDEEDDDLPEDGFCQRVPHHLIVYHALSATMCLMVPAIHEMTDEFYKSFDANLGPIMTNISADLMDVFGVKNRSLVASSGVITSPSTSSLSSLAGVASVTSPLSGLTSPLTLTGGSSADDPSQASVRFIYFNRFNRAMKSTLQGLTDEPGGQEVIRVMLDLSEHLDNDQKGRHVGRPLEFCAKLSSDQWVVAKSADQRQVYVVITSKCANLMDAAEEVEKLMEKEFKNVCLFQQ